MNTRRRFMACAASGLAAAALPTSLLAATATFRRIPQRPSARVIVDNDFAGDPDSLVALAHQLLSPKTRVVLVTSSALERKFAGTIPPDRSAAVGRERALELMRRLGLASPPPVLAGSEELGRSEPAPSTAAKAIVAEALRKDKLPLILTCGGPLTNVAAALRLDPSIAQRMTLIWIGGGRYPTGGWEYNLATDLAAARIVIEQSSLPIWQVPQNAYRQMQFSIAEFEARLRPLSPFAAWLYDQFNSPPDFIDIGGAWPLGDSPTVLLSAISQESSVAVDRPALRLQADFSYGEAIPGRSIRVFETLDARLAFEDFLALLRLHAH